MEKEELKNKLLQSIAFETSANIALDTWTSTLGWAPPMYAAANFLGSSAINLAAQRMRGEEDIKWGETLASGATSIIPFMNPAFTRAQKLVGKPMSIQRGIVGGAITGGAHEGIRIGVDEQRLPTAEEVALGASIGGGVGGVTTGVIKKAAPAATALKMRIKYGIESDPYNKLRPLTNKLGLTETGTVGAMKRPKPFDAFEPVMEPYSLRKQGPYNFLGKRKASAQKVTDPTGEKGYRVTPDVDQAFLDEGIRQTKERAAAYGIDLGKMETHHTAILRQLFESLNGLDDDFIAEGVKFYENALGFKIGWDIENALAIPQVWHPRLHALINSRLSSRSNAWNLQGIERRFGLPDDWQRTLEFDERLPIFQEIVDVIKKSINDTELLYKAIDSRTLKSGKLSKEDFLKLSFDLAQLDNELRGLKSPGLMVKEGAEGLETTSDIVNYILTNADKVDLTLPSFERLSINQTKAVAKVMLQENGAKALYEAIVTGQSADTIFKANNIIFKENSKMWKRILRKLDPEDLLRAGFSIEDIDTFIRSGWADPTKAKSSLKPLDIEGRSDWTKEQLRQAFPDMDEFEIQEWIENQEYMNMD